MPDVLELRVLHVVRHHGVLRWGVRVARRRTLVILVVVIVAVLFAHEVLWAFVLVRAAILRGRLAHSACDVEQSRIK